MIPKGMGHPRVHGLATPLELDAGPGWEESVAVNRATKPAQGDREGVFPMLLLILFPEKQNGDAHTNPGTAPSFSVRTQRA